MVHVIERVSRERHKHKKHSHTTTKKHTSSVDSKASHHKTITLDNIPDSLLPHRSLINYVDDRSKLLDEVFSIFSEEEISNMLPDILKGIKLEEVQQLCYEQLKIMDVAAITQIIQSSSDNSGHTSSKANDISSNEDEAKLITCDPHQAPYQPSKQAGSSEFQVATTAVPSKNSPHLLECNSMSEGNLLSDKQSTISDENCGMNVIAADVSPNVIECSGTNEDSIELLPAAMGDDIDRELTLCQASSAQEHNSKQRVAEIVTHPAPPATTDSNTSETAVLAELQMRKRALQSQLKKQQLEKKMNEWRTKEELLLRQKALQSMLAANSAKKANK